MPEFHDFESLPDMRHRIEIPNPEDTSFESRKRSIRLMVVGMMVDGYRVTTLPEILKGECIEQMRTEAALRNQDLIEGKKMIELLEQAQGG